MLATLTRSHVGVRTKQWTTGKSLSCLAASPNSEKRPQALQSQPLRALPTVKLRSDKKIMTVDFKIAAVCTVYFPASHADVIVSRWLEPFPTDSQWGWQPRTRIASLYVDQFPPNDISSLSPDERRARGFSKDDDLARLKSREYNVPLFDSIRDALTLGGDKLAVDGILLIGEHGDYPFNELGQRLYPRKEFFDEIVATFRASGRSVPVFCDKHLSWNMDWAQEMVNTSRSMGFPLMAGSSLPHTIALQPPLPPGNRIEEGVGLFYVGSETYGFHSLEGMQSFVESRAGGESGIRAVTAYSGEAVWSAMENGAWSSDLFEAALGTCISAQPGDLRENCRRANPYDGNGSPVAFCFEHADGLRTTHVLLAGHIEDFAFALRARNPQSNDPQIHANRWELGEAAAEFHGHFATLDARIQEMFISDQAPVPIERTLLTTKMIATALQALQTPGRRIETPQLAIAYRPML